MKELSPFTGLFDDRLFRDFFPTTGLNEKLPAIDVHEEDGLYRVKADLPGVAKDDIQVTLENGVLSISAETHQQSEEKKEGKVIRRERHEGRYSRSFSVGSNIDASAIKARFEDGVLTLELPKMNPQPSEASQIKVE